MTSHWPHTAGVLKVFDRWTRQHTDDARNETVREIYVRIFSPADVCSAQLYQDYLPRSSKEVIMAIFTFFSTSSLILKVCKWCTVSHKFSIFLYSCTKISISKSVLTFTTDLIHGTWNQVVGVRTWWKPQIVSVRMLLHWDRRKFNSIFHCLLNVEQCGVDFRGQFSPPRHD